MEKESEVIKKIENYFRKQKLLIPRYTTKKLIDIINKKQNLENGFVWLYKKDENENKISEITKELLKRKYSITVDIEDISYNNGSLQIMYQYNGELFSEIISSEKTENQELKKIIKDLEIRRNIYPKEEVFDKKDINFLKEILFHYYNILEDSEIKEINKMLNGKSNPLEIILNNNNNLTKMKKNKERVWYFKTSDMESGITRALMLEIYNLISPKTQYDYLIGFDIENETSLVIEEKIYGKHPFLEYNFNERKEIIGKEFIESMIDLHLMRFYVGLEDWDFKKGLDKNIILKENGEVKHIDLEILEPIIIINNEKDIENLINHEINEISDIYYNHTNKKIEPIYIIEKLVNENESIKDKIFENKKNIINLNNILSYNKEKNFEGIYKIINNLKMVLDHKENNVYINIKKALKNIEKKIKKKE